MTERCGDVPWKVDECEGCEDCLSPQELMRECLVCAGRRVMGDRVVTKAGIVCRRCGDVVTIEDELVSTASSTLGRTEPTIDVIRAEYERQRQDPVWQAIREAERFGGLAVAAAQLLIADTEESMSDHEHDADKYGLIQAQRDPIRRLTLAAALVATEIDRLRQCEEDYLKWYGPYLAKLLEENDEEE